MYGAEGDGDHHREDEQDQCAALTAPARESGGGAWGKASSRRLTGQSSSLEQVRIESLGQMLDGVDGLVIPA